MDNRKIKFFKGWLIFFLVSIVGGGIVGAIAGGILGFILGAMETDIGVIKLLGGVVGFIVGVPISYICYRWTVSQFILPQTLIQAGQTSDGID